MLHESRSQSRGADGQAGRPSRAVRRDEGDLAAAATHVNHAEFRGDPAPGRDADEGEERLLFVTQDMQLLGREALQLVHDAVRVRRSAHRLRPHDRHGHGAKLPGDVHVVHEDGHQFPSPHRAQTAIDINGAAETQQLRFVLEGHHPVTGHDCREQMD